MTRDDSGQFEYSQRDESLRKLEARLDALGSADGADADAAFTAWVAACTEPGSPAYGLDLLGAMARAEPDAGFESRVAAASGARRHGGGGRARRSAARLVVGRSFAGRMSRVAAVLLVGTLTYVGVRTPAPNSESVAVEEPSPVAPTDELAVIELASLIAVDDYVDRLDQELIDAGLDIDLGGAFDSIDSIGVDGTGDGWDFESGLAS